MDTDMDGQTKGNGISAEERKTRQKVRGEKWDSKETRQQRASESSISVRRYFSFCHQLEVKVSSQVSTSFEKQQNRFFTESKFFLHQHCFGVTNVISHYQRFDNTDSISALLLRLHILSNLCWRHNKADYVVIQRPMGCWAIETEKCSSSSSKWN